MTNPHPLTDVLIEQSFGVLDEAEFLSFDYDDLRAAADWQLDQVIEWLQANLWLHDDETGPMYIKEDFLSDKLIDEEKVIEDLKEAMRPQQKDWFESGQPGSFRREDN